MKKILTTTLMTALLATSGFAQDDKVGLWVYETATFTNGTDSVDTTIMPSGTVTIGDLAMQMPVIASTWTLEEGSTMNVQGYGFCLTKELKINPKDAGIPVQCNLKNDGNLYYEYTDSDSTPKKVYKLVGSNDESYVESDGETSASPTAPLTQTMTEGITGAPQLVNETDRANAVILMPYKSEPKTTILPENAKVVTTSTTDLSSITPTDLSGKTFYVYCGKFNNVETEVYSPCLYESEISILWQTCCAEPIDEGSTEVKTHEEMGIYWTQFDTGVLGTSGIYVKGFHDINTLCCEFYTQLKTGTYSLDSLKNYNNRIEGVSLKYDNKTKGCICGGTVTYTTEGGVFFEPNSTDLKETSLKDIEASNKFTIATADSEGFQEGYLSGFPTLECDTNQLDFTSSETYSEKISDSNTLQEYLNSFGFHPDYVSVSSETGIDLLTTKGSEAAIQIPQNYEFSKAASKKTYEIKTNLHNTCQEFTDALKFSGNNVNNNLDTLVFLGNNSNLKPEAGVTYTDVNVTVCNANSWIAPKDGQKVIFKGSSATPTLKVDTSMSICQDLELKCGAQFAVGSKSLIKMFGNLILS